MNWLQVYSEAPSRGSLRQGYYNRNYICRTGQRLVVVRVPISGCDEMDLRLVPEHVALEYAGRKTLHVPRVLFVSEDPPFQVHEYLSDSIVNELYPRGTRLPKHFIPDVMELLLCLYSSTDFESRKFLPGWPEGDDTGGFFDRITAKAEAIYQQHRDEYERFYVSFGVPDDPFASLRRLSQALTRRPLRLCHCDLHRKNCILVGEQTWFIDWELALVADPAYDVAVHLHKMAYLPDEEVRFLSLLKSGVEDDIIQGMDQDIPKYRRLEIVKSIVVDTIRYRKLIHARESTEHVKLELASKLSKKLEQSREEIDNKSLSPDEVLGILSG